MRGLATGQHFVNIGSPALPPSRILATRRDLTALPVAIGGWTVIVLTGLGPRLSASCLPGPRSDLAAFPIAPVAFLVVVDVVVVVVVVVIVSPDFSVESGVRGCPSIARERPSIVTGLIFSATGPARQTLSI